MTFQTIIFSRGFEQKQWSASKIQLFLSNTSVATFLEENSFQIDAGKTFYISKKTIFTWLWTEWSASKIQLLLSYASAATFGVKSFQIGTGIALTFQKIIFWRDFELNQWSVSKINLLLSNASTATFLEVNSFQIETGIAVDISKNHIFTWLWPEPKSASKIQLFLSNASLAMIFEWIQTNRYRNSFWHFKKSDFDVTLTWTKDLHLKCSCFCLMPL